MKRLAALLLAFVMLVGGIAVPADLAARTTPAEAAMYAIPYYGDDFTSYYLRTRLYFQDSDRTLVKGATAKLALSGNTTGGITWKTSNSKVASISQAGKVKAKAAGKATITATNKATGASATCTIKVYVKKTQTQAKSSILALKKTYYQGRKWTNSNYYKWEAAEMSCYGCAALAGIFSDKAFGKYAPFKTHASWSKMKVGDSVRIGSGKGYHSVVVLKKTSSALTVCEGNVNSKIYWNTSYSRAWLAKEGYRVWTRY